MGEKPRIVWEKDMKGDLRIMTINNWTECIQNWVKGKEVAERSRTFKQCGCSA